VVCASESANRLKFVAMCINLHFTFFHYKIWLRCAVTVMEDVDLGVANSMTGTLGSLAPTYHCLSLTLKIEILLIVTERCTNCETRKLGENFNRDRVMLSPPYWSLCNLTASSSVAQKHVIANWD
jgi:hypothetical protein